jgi:hypothetical protein
MEKLPDFKRGYLEDGLEVDEFEEFGPVQLFRSMFMESWKQVLETIKKKRDQKVSPAGVGTAIKRL